MNSRAAQAAGRALIGWDDVSTVGMTQEDWGGGKGPTFQDNRAKVTMAFLPSTFSLHCIEAFKEDGQNVFLRNTRKQSLTNNTTTKKMKYCVCAHTLLRPPASYSFYLQRLQRVPPKIPTQRSGERKVNRWTGWWATNSHHGCSAHLWHDGFNSAATQKPLVAKCHGCRCDERRADPFPTFRAAASTCAFRMLLFRSSGVQSGGTTGLLPALLSPHFSVSFTTSSCWDTHQT